MISLDYFRPTNTLIYTVAGDTARQIEILSSVQLPSGGYYSVRYRKGKEIVIGDDFTDNIVTLPNLTPGIWKAEISVHDGDNLLSAFRFQLKVLPSLEVTL